MITDEVIECIEAQQFSRANELVSSMNNVAENVAIDIAHIAIGHCGLETENRDLLDLIKNCMRYVPLGHRINIVGEFLTGKGCLLAEVAASVVIDDITSIMSDRDLETRVLYEWPYSVERDVCQRLADDTLSVSNRNITIREASFFLDIYNHVHLAYRFSRLMEAVLFQSHNDSDCIHHFLLTAYSRIHFHPYLTYHRNGYFIPCVFSPQYLSMQLVTPLVDCISNCNDPIDKLIPTVVVNSVSIIDRGIVNLTVDNAELIESLIFALLPLIQAFEWKENRVDIMRSAERILDKLEPCGRVVVIKRLVEKLSRQHSTIAGESMLLAWLIDIFRKNLHCDVFRNELGSFWTYVENVKYEDMAAAVSYYNACLTLAQYQAKAKIKHNLLPAIQRSVIDPMRNQLSDYIQLQEFRQKNDEEDDLNLIMNNFEAINIVMFNLDQTKTWIKECKKEDGQNIAS